MRVFLATWPHGAGGDPKDIGRAMRIYLAQGWASRGVQGGPHHTGRAVRAVRTRTAQGHDFSPLRVLFSYHYFKDVDLDALLAECFGDLGLEVDVFADSGAYSAYSTGATIDIVEYASWLRRWKHLFGCAAVLDVVNEPKASFRQTMQLRDLNPGVELIPVFHGMDGSFSYLEAYFREGFKYVGVGPLSLKVAGRADLIDPFCRRCFQMKPPDVRYHAFGMTTWKVMAGYPWFSVDSSSWTSGFRYATVNLFDEQAGRMRLISMQKRHGLLEYGDLLGAYGLRPTDVLNTSFDKDLLCGASVQAWQRAERFLHAQHERKWPGVNPVP